MDKMREEFEVWACNYNLKIADWGNYADRHVNNMWKAWQASRAALYVELPENLTGEYYADGWNACLEFVEGILEGAGVQCK